MDLFDPVLCLYRYHDTVAQLEEAEVTVDGAEARLAELQQQVPLTDLTERRGERKKEKARERVLLGVEHEFYPQL